MKYISVALVALFLASCLPEDCSRSLVTRDGRIEASLQPQFDTAAWGVAGRPYPLRVWAPLSSCPKDSLKVSLQEFADSAGARLPFLVGEPFSTNEGVVGVSVLIEDVQPGEYTLTLGFEPSLGVRRTDLLVVRDGLSSASVAVPLPGGAGSCRGGVWPVNEFAVACERTEGISVFAADGGRSDFQGRALVAAGGTLWSVSQNVLERRVLDNGVLVLTDSFPDVTDDDLAGEHSSSDALRRSTSGEVVRAVAGEGSRVLAPIPQARGVYAALSTSTWLWRAWTPRGCGLRLTCPENVRAVEPDLIWYEADDASLEAKPRTGSPDLVSWRLHRPSPAAEIPSAGFAVAPLWIPTAVDGVVALVTSDANQLSITAWPRDRVVGNTHEFVVVETGVADSVSIFSLSSR